MIIVSHAMTSPANQFSDNDFLNFTNDVMLQLPQGNLKYSDILQHSSTACTFIQMRLIRNSHLQNSRLAFQALHTPTSKYSPCNTYVIMRNLFSLSPHQITSELVQVACPSRFGQDVAAGPAAMLGLCNLGWWGWRWWR